MPVLILKNSVTEGPGTIAGHLDARAIKYVILEPGEITPDTSLKGYDTLVVLGGPMGVYEQAQHPQVREGLRLIKEAASGGMKVLGVCLGAQMLAEALGGRVYKGHGEEAGWLPITCTDEGRADAVFGALAADADEFEVLQWHGDTFDIPPGATRLASSKEYPNQAFVHGGRCYALQFHVEGTPGIVAQWFEGRPDYDVIARATEVVYPECRGRAERFYERFFR